MHKMDPWVSVNRKANKKPQVRTWASFMDRIELQKLAIISVDATEMQHYSICRKV